MTPPPPKLRWTGLLLAYARERLTPERVLPAVLLVVVATLAGGGWSGFSALTTDALLSVALVVAFRLADDLADRERDRVKHPERVVVRAVSLAPLRFAGWLLAFGATLVLLRTHGDDSAAFIWLYATVLGFSYHRRSRGTAAAERIVLLKYGVFTLALIGRPAALTPRGLLAATVAFLIACVYEWWHDAESSVFGKKGPVQKEVTYEKQEKQELRSVF